SAHAAERHCLCTIKAGFAMPALRGGEALRCKSLGINEKDRIKNPVFFVLECFRKKREERRFCKLG
ncbi:MAG: hypothetical protein IKC02_02635, partial [Oscillospiraceae bacterium]|nr:hypothetical protein [Oscillospiraceae bacterium]